MVPSALPLPFAHGRLRSLQWQSPAARSRPRGPGLSRVTHVTRVCGSHITSCVEPDPPADGFVCSSPTRLLRHYLAECARGTPAHPHVRIPPTCSGSGSAFVLRTDRRPRARRRCRCWVSVCWNTLPVVSWHALHYSSERSECGAAPAGPISRPALAALEGAVRSAPASSSRVGPACRVRISWAAPQGSSGPG